ncbi:MAG TPA: cyclase [Actinomycetes bacterium]|nr:cyclase [Actinomycetes bacterium]
MTTIAVRHSVADYDTWKLVFDEHEKIRRSHGATEHRVLREGNNVLALIHFPDAASARTFSEDPSLHDAMERGGVLGAPDVSVWDQDVEERY